MDEVTVFFFLFRYSLTMKCDCLWKCKELRVDSSITLVFDSLFLHFCTSEGLNVVISDPVRH